MKTVIARAGYPVGNLVPNEAHDLDGIQLLPARCHCDRVYIWTPAFMVRRGRSLGCRRCRTR